MINISGNLKGISSNRPVLAGVADKDSFAVVAF